MAELRGLDDNPLLEEWVGLSPTERGLLLTIAQINCAGGRAWGQDIVARTVDRFDISNRHGPRMMANLSEMDAINPIPIHDQT